MKPYPLYKDSGVEWIGEIPENWENVRLKYLSHIKTGDKDTVDRCDDGFYPFFVRADTIEKINSFSFDGEAVLTAGDGVGVGRVFHYINGKFDYHQRVYKISDFIKIDGKYFFYFMKENFHKEVMKISAKSTVDSLRLPMLQNFPVLFGTLLEQQQIANYLDHKTQQIDTLIEKKKRLIDLLKEERTAAINEAVTKGLDPNVKMKDSGIEWLGVIPEHWDVVKIKYLYRLSQEKAPQNNNFELLSLYTDIGVRPRKDLEARGNKASTTDDYWIVNKGNIIVNKLLAWMGAIAYSDYDGVTSPAYDVLKQLGDLNGKYFHYLWRRGGYLTEFKRRSRGIMEMRLRLYFDELGATSKINWMR